ncbi:MAG: Xaa-Pro peptidase family protein [Rikenellaceae bacterium]
MTTTREELELRWARLQKIMASKSIEALVASDNTSIYYLTGRIISGAVYVPAQGLPLIFVRRPIGLKGDNIVYIRKVEDIPPLLAERGYPSPKSVALEGDILSHNEYARYEAIFQPGDIKSSATTLLRLARSVKSEFEISMIRHSAKKHAELYEKIPALFERGMSDVDLAIKLEYEARRLGSVGSMRIFGRSMEAFVGSLLVGANADAPSPYDFALGGAGTDATLPVGCNGTPIVEGNTIMVDQGGNFCSYMTDMTRVFSLGRLPEMAYRAHNAALEMQHELESRAREGVATADIYNRCIEIAKAEGLSDYFMGHTQQAGFVGHGVGIEVNEMPVLAPRSREIFEAGNVIAFEPKFVLPAIGAVGIENTFLIKRDGIEKLTLCQESIIALD